MQSRSRRNGEISCTDNFPDAMQSTKGETEMEGNEQQGGACDLIKMSLGQFINQPLSLCVKREGGDIWVAPNGRAVRRLGNRGIPQKSVSPPALIRMLAELVEVSESTMAEFLAENEYFGEVIAEEKGRPQRSATATKLR